MSKFFFLGKSVPSHSLPLSPLSAICSRSLLLLPFGSTMFSFPFWDPPRFLLTICSGHIRRQREERERERGRKIGWAEWRTRGESGGNKNTPENQRTNQQPTPFPTAQSGLASSIRGFPPCGFYSFQMIAIPCNTFQKKELSY